MTRETIDYGIDLGSTRSAIACLRGTDVEVLRNDEGFETTPSAVWMDKGGNLVVGRPARERLEMDPQNAHSEFKAQMGTPAVYTFARTGRRMRPEELSAEVLKVLTKAASKKAGDEVGAAVITVPAAFELPQCKATDAAAKLAGLRVSPLLQEPVAAAMAYGLQGESDGAYRLVYELGTGTFDAAVLQVRDGIIEVVAHDGDNHLGGKLLDWAIVNQLLIPEVTRDWPLADFHSGNRKWAGAMAKLKHQAEMAKIRLSQENSALIDIDYLCDDDRGDRVELQYTLTRAELARLAEPFLRRTVAVTRSVLNEAWLGPGEVESIILVGGATLMPALRERLVDAGEGLGIPLETGVDPFTVVVRGAAIFAGTQRLPREAGTVRLPAGRFIVELEYEPVGIDTEPLVGGKVVAADGVDLVGHTVEIVNVSAQPPWGSGRLDLSPDGTFRTHLWAERGRANTFRIQLCDAAGNALETQPGSFVFTVGIAVTEPPLIHALGVVMANNEVDEFFRKGETLPLRRTHIYRAPLDLDPDDRDSSLRFPVVEGNRARADRNRIIGYLEIPCSALRGKVPAGSEVEVTLEIDTTRLARAHAHIPRLDQEFEGILHLELPTPDLGRLQKELMLEMARLDAARAKSQETGNAAATKLLERIGAARIAQDVEILRGDSRTQPERLEECQERLLDLQNAIDEVEDALEQSERPSPEGEGFDGRLKSPEDRAGAAGRQSSSMRKSSSWGSTP